MRRCQAINSGGAAISSTTAADGDRVGPSPLLPGPQPGDSAHEDAGERVGEAGRSLDPSELGPDDGPHRESFCGPRRPVPALVNPQQPQSRPTRASLVAAPAESVDSVWPRRADTAPRQTWVAGPEALAAHYRGALDLGHRMGVAGSHTSAPSVRLVPARWRRQAQKWRKSVNPEIQAPVAPTLPIPHLTGTRHIRRNPAAGQTAWRC